MKFKQQPMTRWFSLRLLAATGIKSMISSLFGNFADKREMQAAMSPGEIYDFSEEKTLWFDYVSDLGDGFNSTYTIAHLLAQEKLEWKGEFLNRGKLLIMGGDQVYPTPEMENYDNRLKGPYNAAFPWDDKTPDRPRLVVIPGNHDWYDGLNNFIKLFCQKRALGNWHTMQSRSYLALQLPYRYWIFGVDIQLHSDIDEPQMSYFRGIAENKLQDGDRIILCTAEPAWVYRSLNRQNQSLKRLQFFEQKILGYRKNVSFVAILTGDLHHYSHYIENDEAGNHSCSLITAGGGGAFMHPTHILKEKVVHSEKDQSFAYLKSLFPSGSESAKVALNNLLFPFLNLGFALFLGIIFLLTAWFLQSNSNHQSSDSIIEKLSGLSLTFSNTDEVIIALWNIIRFAPTVVIMNLILLFGLFFFTDVKSGKGKLNYIAGGIHGILQLSFMYLLIWLFSRVNLFWFELEKSSFLQVVLFAFEIALIGGCLSGSIFGLYLLLSTLILKNHAEESFSSLRWTGYKNFLRFRIDQTGITIYPIGIRKIVTDWKNIGTAENPRFQGSSPEYELIESPIHIKK